MIKRLLLIFFILDFGLFFLLTGLFGSNGLFVNKEIEKQIYQVEEDIYKIDNQIEQLKKKIDELETEEGIRESALRLGYKIKGDDIIVFKTSSLMENQVEENNVSNINFKVFRPFSNVLILIISTGISLLFCLILYLILARKEIENDSEQNQSGDDSHYLFSN